MNLRQFGRFRRFFCAFFGEKVVDAAEIVRSVFFLAVGGDPEGPAGEPYFLAK